MSYDADMETSPTLLGRLRQSPADQDAWQAFMDRYGGMIDRWCRSWGLQPADIDDIRQNVLLDLAKQMANFQYDATRSFRAYLKTICRRTWCDYCKNRREMGSGSSSFFVILKSVQAEEQFVTEFEEEWNRELLEMAMREVRGRVQEHTWRAFEGMTREGLSGAEVAERLGMKVGAVWVAKSKVQKMLQDTVQRLEAEPVSMSQEADDTQTVNP